MLVLVASLVPYTAQAGVFDSLKTVVGGHIDDLQSRFMDDQIIEGTEIARAQFREDDRGQDTLHNGSGTVTIVETDEGRFLQLGSDFSSTPGPDYHVYVSQDSNVDHEDRFDKSRQIELGRLIKGSGASYYKIPADTEFKSVTIWCKAFGEFIVSADFE
ncbi:MAG: DM13 domain-containing protein [Pseudomonadales bacterium]|nr:DM13 domain-containing protein [Pseudomonadales bacterium]